VFVGKINVFKKAMATALAVSLAFGVGSASLTATAADAAPAKNTLTLKFLLPISNLDRADYIIPDVKAGITKCNEVFRMLNVQKPESTMVHIFVYGQYFSVENEKGQLLLKDMARPKYTSTPDGRYCNATISLKLPKAKHYDIYDARQDLILEGFAGTAFSGGKAEKQLSPWK